MSVTSARLLVRLLAFAVLCAIGLPADAQAPAAEPPALVPGEEVTLSGQLLVVWGDPSAGGGGGGEALYALVVGGNTVQLLLDEGLPSLNRQQVTVQGRWEAGVPAPGMSAVLRVRAIEPAPRQGQEVTGSQPWISVMCKFSDIPSEPKDLHYFQGMYANIFPGLDHFWREVSYDQIDLVGSGAVGWYTLPRPRSYYVYDNDGDGEVELDWGRAADDCTAVADPDVYFPQFAGINLMFNADLDCCAWGGSWYLTLDGQTILYRVTWEPPWGYSNVGVIAHETGHGFGLPHSSGQCGQVYDNRWDVMSDVWTDCGNLTDPTYGCVGQGTISFHLALNNWVPPQRKVTVDTRSRVQVTLEQLDLPPPDNYLMATIPIDDSPTYYYTVEARRKVGYDRKLPGQGVIVHEVVIGRGEPAHVVDVDHDCNTGDAFFGVGQSFVDATNGISVTVDAATDTGWTVTISNRYVEAVPVHVRSIAMRYAYKNGWYLANAGARIVDPAHLPVAGVVVGGRWTLPDGSIQDQEVVSADNGQARFKVKSHLTGAYELCVTGVVKTGYVYDPDQNHVTCRSLAVP